MKVNLEPFFRKYESLVVTVDSLFQKVKSEYSSNMKCVVGCDDCCYALFDLTLIEALYINACFNNKFSGLQRLTLIDKANRSDRKTYKIKRDAHKTYLDGASELEILGRISSERVRCPLLSEESKCDLYENRPLTCRLYGIPTSASGISHTCGKSGFIEGEKYPTLNMDVLYKQLYDISSELISAIGSKNYKMSDMLVPLSMALITIYDEEYLGISSSNSDSDNSVSDIKRGNNG